METDTSRKIFNHFSKHPDHKVRLELKDGKIVEGHIAGYYRGLKERGENYIFRWRILPASVPLTDYDRTLNSEDGIIVDHNTILNFTFL